MPFLKPTNSIVQGKKVIEVNSERDVLLEIELGVVIRKNCSQVSLEKAHDMISGYFLTSDLTARRKHILGAFTDIFYFKQFNNFTPISEQFIEASQIKDPQNLKIEYELIENGVVLEEFKFNTSEMVWTIAEQISFLSKRCDLVAGDLILTGSITPPFIRDGQRCESRLIQDGDIVAELNFDFKQPNFGKLE